MPGPRQVISVVTPVHAAGAGHLAATYASLAAQELPAGWSWEWLVQEDGQTGLLDEVLLTLAAQEFRPRDRRALRTPRRPRATRGLRVVPGSGRAGGPGVARTLALARATGSLVRALDADDVLPTGALGRDIAAMCAYPEAGFVTSAALDLRPDGTLSAPVAHEDGPLPRGSLFEHWCRHGHRLAVHPATLCIRRELLLALGGWMALPASEDTGLLLAANAVVPGYHLDTPGLHYRKWPAQATAQPAHTDPAELSARISMISQRAEVLSTLPAWPPVRSDRS